MKFILLFLLGTYMSAVVASINYSETELSSSQEALTNAIMTAIIEKCDNLDTREAYYNCVADSVNKIIKTSVLPAPPIPWEQNPPREPGPDEVPNTPTIGWPLAMGMPDYPSDDDRRGGSGPDDVPNDGPDGPVREIPLGPGPFGPDGGDNSAWPLF